MGADTRGGFYNTIGSNIASPGNIGSCVVKGSDVMVRPRDSESCGCASFKSIKSCGIV